MYLGGLGRGEDLSPHLASRHEVGRTLRTSQIPTAELRASIVIGSGSASFETVRALVEHDRPSQPFVAPPPGFTVNGWLNAPQLNLVGTFNPAKVSDGSSALSAVRSEKTNIITIEDPVEYQIPGVNQTQINEKIKLTFAAALRSILRQDPDVILVGEIRDAETAKISMQAAQTGHLVLSTLHTDDAPSVVTRLMDIGTEPYVIASALIGVVAQRLVRRLCIHCRRQYTPGAETLRALNIAEADAAQFVFYKSVGCDQCNHTGYRGRIGIYEVMRVTDKLRRLISSKAPEDQLREAAITGGMISLGEDGLAKVKSGITTPEELLRVVTEVREMRTLCTGCGAAVGVDFLACPQCGKRLSGGCPHCGRALQPGWNFCPYCARSTMEPKRAKRLKERESGDGREGRRELPAANVAEFKK